MRVVWNQKVFRVLQCFYILYWSDFKWLKLHNWYSANHNDFHLFFPTIFLHFYQFWAAGALPSCNNKRQGHRPMVTLLPHSEIYLRILPIWCFCGSNKMSEVTKTKRSTEVRLGWQMWCRHEVKNNGPIAQKDLIPVANSGWPVNLISMSLDWLLMDSNPWSSCFKVTVLYCTTFWPVVSYFYIVTMLPC